MTSSDFADITRNQQAAAEKRSALEKRAIELQRAGFETEKAKAGLALQGLKVTGALTALQLARIEQSVGRDVTKVCLTCTKEKVSVPIVTDFSKIQDRRIKQFLKQTGRSNMNNLSPAELFAWNKLNT